MSNESCEYVIDNGAVAQGDADISGVGVILAFTISAYVTFVAVLLAYFCGLVDSSLLGPIDQHIFHITPYIATSRSRRSRRHKYLREVVLALSDQQIVTGIAIMAAGFQGLRSGTISVYHFQVVLYLAWMSSSVHLSAITLLQSYLKERQGILIWRLTGMVVLLVMLVIGLIPTISNDWGILQLPGYLDGRTGWAIPAKCFWWNLWDDGAGPDAPLGFIILAITYLWKMGGIFDRPTTAYYKFIRIPFENVSISILRALARKLQNNGSILWLWLFRLVLAFLVPFMTSFEMGSSFAASLWLSITSLLYGTIQIVVPRTQMLPFTGSTENSWGFGQLVPLILLAQPLGVVFEFFWSRDGREAEEDGADIAAKSLPNRNIILQDRPSYDIRTLPELLLQDRYAMKPVGEEIRREIWVLFFRSKTFAAIVYLIQFAIMGICAAVFYFDALTIGYARNDNWQFILFSIAGVVGLAFGITLIATPFSILGRRDFREEGERFEKSYQQLG